MGMGMGGWNMPPPKDNPLSFQEDQGPRDPRRSPHLRRGKWSEDAVDQDLPIIEATKRVIDNPASMIGAEAGGSLKSKLKYGLKQLGWKYNRRATFKANFPFGSTYVIFESTPELDAGERYMIRMVMGNSRVLDYRIMQLVFVETPARGFELKFIDILTNRVFLIVVLLTTVILLAVIFMYALGVFQQPVE